MTPLKAEFERKIDELRKENTKLSDELWYYKSYLDGEHGTFPEIIEKLKENTKLREALERIAKGDCIDCGADKIATEALK
jgi:hypothetical protein